MHQRALLRNTKTGILPTGRLLNWRSELDPRSNRGIELARKVLNKEGLVILDAHLGTLDIMATTNEMTMNLPLEKVVMPVAGYNWFAPIARNIMRGIDVPEKGLLTLPVYRKEEWIGGGWWRVWRTLYLKRFNRMHTRWFNMYFVLSALKAIRRPNQAVVVAPYGGPASYGSTVRRGVAKVLRTGAPAIATLSVFDWRHLKYRVYVLPYIMRFKRFSSLAEINNGVYFAFKSLEAWRESKKKIIN